MSKILSSWSGIRKYLEEEMLANSIKGRVRYGCTTYIGMDDCKIFEVCVDGEQVKRFSLETVNTYFINNGLKMNNNPVGKVEYWTGFWQALDSIPLKLRTEYTDDEFCDALRTYRNQDIQMSINSENPMIRMFAILDRRLGKRTLENILHTVDNQPLWLQRFYNLRLESEFK